MVEEAWMPAVRRRMVEVEFALEAKEVVGVNGKEKKVAAVGQDTPVFESTPLAENVAQPVEPPAEETMRLVLEAVVEVMAVVEAYGNVDALVEVEVIVPPTNRLLEI